MNLKVKKALKIASSLLIVIVIVLAVLLVGVKFVGIDVLTILSPSMEPKYPTGSLVYLVDVDPSKLKVNDVITFKISDGMTATHRIKEIIPDEEDPNVVRFRTKGDNNDTYDGSLVEFDDIQGKVVFCIPLLGYLAMRIQSPPGSFIAIGVGLAIVLFVMIVDTVTDEGKSKKIIFIKEKTKMKNSKPIVLALCAVLLVAATVFGTVAYLTDNAAVVNTFTVGQVKLRLDEAKVDAGGKPTGERTEIGNSYHLIPGVTYTKDPTVTVLGNSEEC